MESFTEEISERDHLSELEDVSMEEGQWEQEPKKQTAFGVIGQTNRMRQTVQKAQGGARLQ